MLDEGPYRGSAAIADSAVQRSDPALIKCIWVGAGPNEFVNNHCLLVRIPNRRPRPTIDSIMKRFCTTPVLRMNIRAPGDQLPYKEGLFCRRSHMQSGITFGNVVLDPIKKILLCGLSRCATSSALACQVWRSVKQLNGSRAVTGDDGFDERSEGVRVLVNRFQFLAPRGEQTVSLSGADDTRLS